VKKRCVDDEVKNIVRGKVLYSLTIGAIHGAYRNIQRE